MISFGNTIPQTWKPYKNECPIIGRDSVVVERTSANYVTEYLNGSNVIADGSIVSNEQYSLALLPIKQGETYTASHNTESYWVWAFYRSKPTIGSVSYNNDRTLDVISTSKTFTAPIDGYIAIRVPVAYRELMVNGGSTALPYEPSYATDFTIQLGTTVYAGVIDWTTGVGTVTDISTTFDGSSDEEWSRYNQGSASAYAMQIDNTTGNSDTNVRPMTNGASGLNSSDTYGNYDCFISTSHGANWIAGRRGISTVEDWKTWLASNPIQVCYKLATPTTIQLTPEQLEMLKGYNRVSVGGGYATIELKALVLGGDN